MQTSGAETIDNVGATGVATITVSSGEDLELISTGNTTGITWEVVKHVNTTAPSATEPWYNVATNLGATSVTQQIYHSNLVGINTTTPEQALHVTGNVLATAATASAASLTWSNMRGDGGLRLFRDVTATPSPNENGYVDFLYDRTHGLYDARITFGNAVGTNGALQFKSTTDGTLNTTSTNMSILNSNGNVGIGTTTPAQRLHVIGSIVTDATSASAVGASVIQARRSRGTVAAPTAVLNGDVLGNFWSDGHDGTAYSAAATLWRGRVKGTWTSTSHPAYMEFLTSNANNLTAQTRMVIDTDGKVGINTSFPYYLLDLGNAGGANIGDSANKKLAVFTNGSVFYGIGRAPNILEFHCASAPTTAPGMVLQNTSAVGMGTGTDLPDAGLHRRNEGSLTPLNSIALADYYGTSATATPGFWMRRQRGTAAAPANLVAGDQIGRLIFSGRVNGNNATQSEITSTYRGTGTNISSDLVFNTSNTTRQYIDEAGLIGMGTVNTLSHLHINNDNQSNAYDDLRISTYSSSTGIYPAFFMHKSTGTEASPGNMATGSGMGSVSFGGTVNGSLQPQLSSVISFYTGSGTTALSDLRFSTSNAVQMYIDQNGFVDIGSTSPRTQLDVRGTALVAGGTFPTTANATGIGWNAVRAGIGETEIVNYRGTGAGGFRFYCFNGTGTPTYNTNDVAFISNAGVYSALSDARVKTNIKTVGSGLQKVMAMRSTTA